MDIGHRETTLRPLSGQALAVSVVLICVITEVAVVLRDDVVLDLRVTPLVALAGFGAVAVFWLPAVRVGPAFVELINIVRSITVTWPAVEDVETRWALTLITARGTFTSWAAPRSSSVGSARAMKQAAAGTRVGATASPAQALTTVAALAPVLVLRQWREYRDAGLLGDIEGTGVTVVWHRRTILALAALTILSIAALVTP